MKEEGNSAEKSLEELGEEWALSKIISAIRTILGGRLGIGDDAVELPVNNKIIVSGDMLVSSTDVPPGMTPRQTGVKAVTSVVSDFAAKGAQPLFFITELGLPKTMKGSEFSELLSGILDAASFYGGRVVAGDTNQANEIVIGVVGIGYSDSPLPRSGARPGDIVAVTGFFGKTYTGLHAAFNANLEEKWKPLIESILNPKARLVEGLTISRAHLATASIDSSDGLEACLYELSHWSQVGFRITDPPIDPLAQEYAETYGLDLIEAVFRGGEEYELVVTIPREKFEEAASLLKEKGCNLIPIGEATNNMLINLELGGKSFELRGRGWTHFRRNQPNK